MFLGLKRFQTKYIVLISIISFLIGAGVVALYFFNLLPKTAFIIILFLVFLTFSTCTSALFEKYFQKKMKFIGYHPKDYYIDSLDELINILEKIKGKKNTLDYGEEYLYKENNIAYKITIVSDASKYFKDEEIKVPTVNTNKGYFNGCKKLIDFEIFINPLDDYLRKIALFNYQGETFYFASFRVKENQITQLDFVKPNDEFNQYYNNVLDLLGIKENNEK